MAQTVLEGDWVKVTFDGDGTDSGEGNENLLVEALSQNTARVSTRSVTLNGETDSGTHAECEIIQNPKGPFIQFNEDTFLSEPGEKFVYVIGHANTSYIHVDEIVGGGISASNIAAAVITLHNGTPYTGTMDTDMVAATVSGSNITFDEDYGAEDGYTFSIKLDVSGWDRLSAIEITFDNFGATGETYVEDYCEIVNDI